MSEQDGGRAFPVPAHEVDISPTETALAPLPTIGGMTLRDYFAAQALAAEFQNVTNFGIAMLARRCYEMADAMLKERAK